MRDNEVMSNPNDPNGAQGSDQGSSDQTPSGPGQSPSGFGQNPGGYDQNPTGGYGENPPGYDQNAGGYGRDSGSYAPAPYGQGYSAPAGGHPQGTTILVLGIVGIFFTICAP